MSTLDQVKLVVSAKNLSMWDDGQGPNLDLLVELLLVGKQPVKSSGMAARLAGTGGGTRWAVWAARWRRP